MALIYYTLYSSAVQDIDIKILTEPQNITIAMLWTAHFICSYTGTAVPPLWIIDNEVFTVDQLPARHSYSNHVLTVSNVQVLDSGRTYCCSFIGQESRTATLTVLSWSDRKY